MHDKRISLDDGQTTDSDDDKSKREVERELMNGSSTPLNFTIPPMIATAEIVPSIPTHDFSNTPKHDIPMESNATMEPGSPMEPKSLLKPGTQDVGILDESVPDVSLSEQSIAYRSRRETRNRVPIR